MSADTVLYACKLSVEANKRNIQYIKAILNNWYKAGIKTLIEAQNEHTRNKQKNKQSENLTYFGETEKLYEN